MAAAAAANGGEGGCFDVVVVGAGIMGSCAAYAASSRGVRVLLLERLPEGWTAATSDLGGVMKATKAVAMFQSLAAKNGAVLRDRTEVVDVAKQGEGSVVVKTSSGEEFRGAKCIITVGAWASKLLRSVAGVDLPVQPLHTLICYWKVRPGHEHELTTEAGFPTFASYGDPYIYSTPSMEFPSLIKVAAHGGPPLRHARPRRHRRRAGHPAVVHVLHDPRRGLHHRLRRRGVREGRGRRRRVLRPWLQDGAGRREDPRRDGHGRRGQNGGGGRSGAPPFQDWAFRGQPEGKPHYMITCHVHGIGLFAINLSNIVFHITCIFW
uniref:FAD dependent oxidoreductase domain-containing protein n=1 Tax=Oryza brachyantha TaxID=4533 RepID=J3MYU6_ORYBR